MPSDVGGDTSPYGSDWSLGATLGAEGIVFVGEIPADLSAPYTPPPGWEWGFGIVPPPDPSTYVTPHPVEAAPPAVDVPADQQGGPEEIAPPDFDAPPIEQPPPTEAPPPSLPETVPPPLEGEIVGPDIVYHDYEGYDQLPDPRENFPEPPKRIIEGELDRPFPFSLPPIIPRRFGPFGAAASIWEFSGEVTRRLQKRYPPLPPEIGHIPQVTIPPPVVAFPEPAAPPTPEPYALDFPTPAPPEVIVVTPPEPLPAPAVPRSLQTPRAPGISRAIGPALAGLASILRPIRRRRGQPSERFLQNFNLAPELNFPQPLPQVRPDPLSPAWPQPGTDPLTPPSSTVLPLTQTGTFGPLQMFTPQQTKEDDRCRCKENKHEPDPSDVVANVKVYKRRMSNWSLKNLNRGTKAANLVRKFL